MGKTKSKKIAAAKHQDFKIKYPILWLFVAVIIVYISSLQLGYTELDDSIFIRDFHAYNEDLSNLFTSFHRGVFSATNDTYYRPFFLNSIIINYIFSEQNPEGYHLVNIILHLLSVLLLFNLFKKLGVSELHAFLLTLIFAVHPVLSQAVAWIPGRNDTLLAVFTLSFLVCSINYSNSGRLKWLILSFLALTCALFTKETAVFNAPVAFVILIYVLKKRWLEKRIIIQYAAWIAAIILWFAVRSTATLQTVYLEPKHILKDFGGRLPVVIQYIGKIFFPFNLNVFPMLEDTVYYYGIAAILLLALIVFLAKGKNIRLLLGGLAIFFLFLAPALLVPRSLNEQLFEHRLYLPIIGMLLILPQTILLKNNLKDSQLLWRGLVIVIVFAGLNIYHQQRFDNPIAFWSSAAESSPHSAYAVMMYGQRIADEDKEKGYGLIRKAYSLNPDQKYINYYYGKMLQNEDSIQASEKYLLKEKQVSNYYECDFYLARVALEKKPPNTEAAATYLQNFLAKDSLSDVGNNNLLVLYIQTGEKAKASAHIKRMQSNGLTVNNDIINKVNSMQ